MSISRWDPLSDLISLREAMSNLLEESYVRPRSAGAGVGSSGLAVDVRETPERFVVVASVPGVRPEDVQITVLGDTLRVQGERREESEHAEGEGGRWLVRERRVGSFERTISLPSTVKTDAAIAEFKDGVLTVTLPKTEEAKPRTIPVRSGAPNGGQAIEVNSTGSDA